MTALLSVKALSSPADLLEGEGPPCILLMDGIEDPQNLGAILRTAEGAGVNGVILPERHSAGLTGTVSAVSAGALAVAARHGMVVAPVLRCRGRLDTGLVGRGCGYGHGRR